MLIDVMKILSRMMLLTLALPLVSTSAHALGRDGHEAVCYIAYDQVTPETRQRIDTLIAADPKYSQISDPAEAFAKSCVWADEVKPARWEEHFVNVPRDTKKITSLDCPEADKCLLSAIVEDAAVLRDPEASGEDKLMALKFMGHWIGDLHQPLHVAFKSDKGGNDIPVEGADGCDNLHSVWDHCLLAYVMGEPNQKDSASFARLIIALLESWPRFEPIERTEYVGTGSVTSWADRVFQVTISHSVAYCSSHFPEEPCPERDWSDGKMSVPKAYMREHGILMMELVARSGVALARLLNGELALSDD